MPFSFRRHDRDQKGPPAGGGGGASAEQEGRTRQGVAFDGLSEEWRLRGYMRVEGRLSDVLNRREPIPISDMEWAPVDGSEPFSEVPGLKSVDPYDLIVVLAGEGSLPPLSDEERAAHKVHKLGYDVTLDVPPFRVTGTVYLYPGTEPARLMERATEMFVPVLDAVVMLGERQLNDETVEAVLVNRFYLRGVEQIDRRTGARAVPLPGQPLGSTTWTDRSR